VDLDKSPASEVYHMITCPNTQHIYTDMALIHAMKASQSVNVELQLCIRD